MWNEFIRQFITLRGYENVLNGVWVTLRIAVFGLLIGIAIGTLIAVVRVMPKYKLLPRILDKICVCYIALFRGTPMVVQLLIGYWVLLPALGITVDSGVPVGKKCDFIIQEMNRETNTIGSKCSDNEIARLVVEMKSELEKIREQIQNIE